MSCWCTVASAQVTADGKADSRKLPVLAPRVSYEQQRTDRLLAEKKLEQELSPEGKRIAFVMVERDDVFVADEVWPIWLNWFHGRTRDSVVRRELLFVDGEPFQMARIEETMRNLRGMGIFALVRITAVKTDKPDEVGVVVHTRDLWSLRLEQDFNYSSQLNSLLVRITERNFLGRNKNVSADYTLLPKNYMLTESYYARRVWGSSLALKQSAGLIFNRSSNRNEGKLATLSVGQPLYYLAQRYSWLSSYAYDNRVYRALRGNDVLTFPEPRDDEARRVYRGKTHRASLLGYRRFGEQTKQTFGAGWDVRTLRVNTNRESRVPEELREEFLRRVLPQERTDSGPVFNYDFFLPRWVTFVNLATYGQSENVRVGPAATVEMRVPLRGFGSRRNALVASGALGLTLAPRGALIDARAGWVGRYQGEQLIDRRTTLLLRGASPVFSIFRCVARLSLELRQRDSQNTLVTLGSDNGLRGYESQALFGYGANRALANFELRTLPIEWQALHLGGVLFYDVGSVYQHASDMQAYHAVGVGVRLLFPQFNRMPFSFDGGMSFDPGFRFVPAITGGQNVAITAAEDAE